MHGAQTPVTRGPTEWTRVRLDSDEGTIFPASVAAPPFVFGPAGTPVKSIVIIHDEGTDTANNDTQGVGIAVLDNIEINGKIITRDDDGDD